MTKTEKVYEMVLADLRIRIYYTGKLNRIDLNGFWEIIDATDINTSKIVELDFTKVEK